jgi:hypothetical protein
MKKKLLKILPAQLRSGYFPHYDEPRNVRIEGKMKKLGTVSSMSLV